MTSSDLNRKLITGLSAFGTAETGYLTLSKFAQSTVFCSGGDATASCNSVLATPYSTIPIVNIPLTLVAFVAYASVFGLSVLQAGADEDPAASSTNTAGGLRDPAILFLSTSMATFSVYLMSVLNLVLNQSCAYCYLSAFLSISMALLAWNTNMVTNKTKATVIASSSMLLTGVTSIFLFYLTSVITLTGSAEASTAPAGQMLEAMEKEQAGEDANKPPTITRHSSEQALKIASRLKNLDAKMYGAFWCSHCYNQKQVLGIEAYSSYEYIECAKDGYKSDYPLCRSKNVSIILFRTVP
jgi:uncharacterized membrane protein